MENIKKISVIMGIYNCADTLEEAVKSILDQTYTNWELIMCDDGSVDDTYEVAKKLKKNDSRIILLRNKENRGLNYTLNHCLKKVSGDYIARMDGDDVCVPERFETQLKCFEEHPDISIVSSSMFFFDENGKWGRNHTKQYPTKEDVVTGSPICHAPVMMKKECMDAVNGYTVDKRMLRVEDVNLWIKLYAKGYRCFNIDEPLYGMRNDQNALNRRKYRYRINSTYVRLLGCRMLKLDPICYIKSLRPLIYGLVPAKVRQFIRKQENGFKV